MHRRIRPGAVLALLLLFGGLLAAQDGGADERLAAARKLFASGKRVEARRALEALTAAEKAPAEAWSLLGLVLMEPPHGEIVPAQRAFERALLLDPKDLYGNYGSALILSRSGRQLDSLPHFERALAAAPTYGQCRYEYALALYYLGRVAEAEQQFRKCTEMPQAVEYLAIIEARRERHAAAAELIRKLVVKMGPDWSERPRLLYQGGAFLVMAAQPEKARPLIDAAIAAGFERAEALNELAQLVYDSGDLDRAFELWKRAAVAPSFKQEPRARSASHADAHYNAGLVLYKKRRYEEARAELRKAIELDRYHPNAWYKLGQTLQRLQKPEEARAALAFHGRIQPIHSKIRSVERSLVNDPSSAKNRFGYARLLASMDRDEEALRQLRILEQRSPDHPGLDGELATVLEKLGRDEEAEVHRRRSESREKAGDEGDGEKRDDR